MAFASPFLYGRSLGVKVVKGVIANKLARS